MKSESQVKEILKVINLMLDQLSMIETNIGYVTVENMQDIIEKQELNEKFKKLENSFANKKFIKLSEFKDDNKFYDILYSIFLNRVQKLAKNKEGKINLFKTFNQAYYYKKYIKYMSDFIEKHPKTLIDDIMKEKLFEIVNCLESSDKLYTQDFYFYISIFHIHYHYGINDVSIPEFQEFNIVDFEEAKTCQTLSQIKTEKLSLFNHLIPYIKSINSKGDLAQILSNIRKEIQGNNIYNIIELNKINWKEINTETEKKFIEYLAKNNSDRDVIALKNYADGISEIKDQFNFYYLDKTEKFFSLSKEDKYILINSYDYNIRFCKQILNYISLKKSYDEGMKKENILKETIKSIIEKKEFFNLIKELLRSGKIEEYCKNPIQYIKNNGEIKKYNEKEQEKEQAKKEKEKEKENKKVEISKFNSQIEPNKEVENQDIKDNLSKTLEKEIKALKEEDFKCKFEKDYLYFIDKVFNEQFLTDRVIYSFLPYGIKAFVSGIPKIVINMCGNNITFYKKKNKSYKDYTTILTALYVVIILHELIHLIRRENPNKPITNEYTPKPDNLDYEGGRSFIYHIFGDFCVVYLDLNFAEKILDKTSWTKGNNILRDEYLKIKDRENKDIDKYMEEKGGIRCYDSLTEEKKNLVEEDYYCC